MSDYRIYVKREGKDTGTLYYRGTIDISATCWWDPNVKIPSGTYTQCSATTMHKKKNSSGDPREGIYIPNVLGHSQIFVHMGTSPLWSDGCIVIPEEKMLEIYNDIHPKDGRNVTITIY
jgi:hypothetical protein